MARRALELDAEALEIEARRDGGDDLDIAGVAGAGVEVDGPGRLAPGPVHEPLMGFTSSPQEGGEADEGPGDVQDRQKQSAAPRGHGRRHEGDDVHDREEEGEGEELRVVGAEAVLLRTSSPQA